jgi:autotransporter-associated beta strand protein
MKALLIAAACAFASPVFGQWVWNGSESGEWNDSANWTPAGVPGSWNSVLFDSAGGGHTWIDLPTSPVTVKNITFDSASCDAYTIGKPGEELHLNWSGAVTLNAGVTQNQTIAADFIQMNCDGGQNASYNLVNNSVASLNTAAHIAPGPGGVTYTLFLKGSGSGINNLSGLISDGTTLIELGLWVEGGIWALTGSNTFGGGVTIEGGTLVANTIVNGSQSSSLGNSDNTDTNLAFTSPSGSSTLRYVGADTSTNRNFWINDGSTAIFDIAGGNLTFTGGANNINNTGSLVKSGSAMLAFNSNNYYSGATTISGGVLSVMTVANGGQASGIGKSSSDASNLVFDGGTLQYANTSVSRSTQSGTICSTQSGTFFHSSFFPT